MKLFNIISEREMSRLAELDAPMLGQQPAGQPGAQPMTPAQDPQAQAKLQAQQVKQLAD